MTGGTHRLESRMREIRPSGSEGGGAGNRSPYPYQDYVWAWRGRRRAVRVGAGDSLV